MRHLMACSSKMIEFTPDEIRDVWRMLFGGEPNGLTDKQVFEACVMELGPEILRQALEERKNR